MRDRIPPRAIANDLDWGEVPPELECLSIPEQLLVSIYRCRAHIIELRSVGGTAGQRAIRGNAVTFPMDAESVARRILPARLGDLADQLRVVFAGSRIPNKVQLSKVLKVSRTRVQAALLWLIKNNPLYFHITIDEEALAALPDDGVVDDGKRGAPSTSVPDSLINSMVQVVPLPRWQEGEGYASTDFFAPRSEDEKKSTPEENKASTTEDQVKELEQKAKDDQADEEQVYEPILQESGVLDVHGVEIPQGAERDAGLLQLLGDIESKTCRKETEDRKTNSVPATVVDPDAETLNQEWEAAAGQVLNEIEHKEEKRPAVGDGANESKGKERKERILILGHGKHPESEYNNPDIWMGGFPRQFPYGRGGPETRTRRVELSMKSWVQHVLHTRDSRFRTYPAILFVLYNTIHRRLLCRQARLHTRSRGWKVTAKRLAALSRSDIEAALNEQAASRKPSADPSAVPTTARDRAATLLSNMESVVGKIPGTDWRRKRIRNNIYSSMLMFGIPSFFITINPADLYNRIPAYYATISWQDGKVQESFQFDSRDDPLPGFPKFVDRCRAMVQDPVAAVKFFNVSSFSCLRYW